MTIYSFTAETAQGKPVELKQYEGKVLLVVNTASKCGFTPQYEDLQKLYERYKDQGLEILGFPCNQFGEQEPGTNDEVQSFCKLNYGVGFPIFGKVQVRGPEAHPLFQYLTGQKPFQGLDPSNPSGKMLSLFLQEKFPEYLIDDSIKWNFTKFLIDRNGQVAARYESTVEPMDMEADIEKLL